MFSFLHILDWRRVLLHIPVGIATALLVLVDSVLPLIATIGFVVYEVNEDMHLKDGAYQDLAGWLVGVFIGSGIAYWLLPI